MNNKQYKTVYKTVSLSRMEAVGCGDKQVVAMARQKAQQGSVLLWGLVILLVMTVIGVAAARMGVTDIRIASNQIFSAMTYQSAESVLERVSTLFNIEQTDATTEMVESWSYEDDMNEGKTSATGTVSLAGSIQCVAQEGFAMSTEMTADSGGFSCLLYTVNAQAHLVGTGARSNHSQGIIKYVPAGSSVSSAQ